MEWSGNVNENEIGNVNGIEMPMNYERHMMERE
jgi:hypothetical protein